MSDTTITAEERDLWASTAAARINAVTPERQCEITAQERLVSALKALEQAEARAEKAESDKAALEEDLEAAEKNLKETSGFIEELLSGLKHRFPVQYADLEGDEYDDDAFSSHDLFEIVINPAVNAAQKAEADNDSLTKMVDWLANKLIYCPPEFTNCALDCAECRKEAARRAVAAGEEPCQK